MRRIIGVSGLARSGKDSVASILIREYGFVRVAFGDKLKEAAYALDPLVMVNGDVTRLQDVVDEVGWDRAKAHPEVRRTLQRLGSDAGWRIHGKNLWVEALESTVSEMDEETSIVIPDVRFHHEATWVLDNLGSIITVIRPENDKGLSGDLAVHDSELGIGDDIPTEIIFNDGSLVDLQDKVRSYVGR